MRNNLIVYSTVLLLNLVFTAEQARANEAFKTLATAKAIKCSFEKGTKGTWKGKSVNVEKNNKKSDIEFDSINIMSGEAYRTDKHKSTSVIAMLTTSNLTFIEQTDAGNVAFTTVSSVYADGSKEFIAVNSEHVLVSATSFARQYHGTCKIMK